MEGLFQLRRVVNNPAIQCTVINVNTAFRYHLFNMTITEGICAVSANALKDDGFRCVAAFEGDHGLLNFVRFINIILPYDDLASLDATELRQQYFPIQK
jgi:hypothetical protein